MNLKNLGNQYAKQLGDAYDHIPKTVLAAIAVSALTCGGDHIEDARRNVLAEWYILNLGGVIPQKPPAEARDAFDQKEEAEQATWVTS